MSKASHHPLKVSSAQEQNLEQNLEKNFAERAVRQGRPGMAPGETAQYIAEFTAELSFLARRTQLDLLAYLLDMARLEAIRVLQANERKD